jgi:hypothetical protein
VSEDRWSVFAMKPVATIEHLARLLVRQQQSLARLRELAAALPADDADERVRELRARVAAAQREWTSTQLPSLAASFRLAVEVLDTYGPAGARVADPIEAAAWNNKYFVWRDEFTPPQ